MAVNSATIKVEPAGLRLKGSKVFPEFYPLVETCKMLGALHRIDLIGCYQATVKSRIMAFWYHCQTRWFRLEYCVFETAP